MQSTISVQEKAPPMCSADTFCETSRMRRRYFLQRALAAAAPDDPRPYCNLGLLFYMLGRVDDAIAMHEQALARDPCFAFPHQHLGEIYIVRGEYEKAWAHARRAAELGNTVVLDMLNRYPKVTRPPD